MVRKSLYLIAALSLFATAIHAAVPAMINFQGLLTDDLGVPITGSQTLTFRLYDVPVGGVPVWQETQNVTADSQGRFNALLGSTTPLDDSYFTGTSRYVSVAVGLGPESSPRVQIVTVAFAHRVGTVDGASGGEITSKVTIGPGHVNTGTNAFVAGHDNSAAGDYSVIGGGHDNSTGNDATTIGGGSYNHASGFTATVGGGYGDTASAGNSTVAGGSRNRAAGDYSFVGGGLLNAASGNSSTVAGGSHGLASGASSTIGGGYYDTASGQNSTIAGGAYNRATAIGATVGGGSYCYAREAYSVVSGGGGILASDSNSTKAYRSVIGGGRRNTISVAGDAATIAGGDANSASASWATVAGGLSNSASGSNSAVGGGSENVASGSSSTVAGGYYDTASGEYATVPGGLYNVAEGNASFAAGNRAKARHNGTFVWADNLAVPLVSTGVNQFLVRASGGVGINTNSPFEDLTVSGSLGFKSVPAPEIYMFENGTDNPNRMILAHSPDYPDYGLAYWDLGDKFVFVGNGIPAMTIDLNNAGGYVGLGGTLSPPNILTLPNINSTDGRAIAFAWDVFSSRRWKTNIQPLEGSLDKVKRLQGVSYDPKEGGGRQIGLIAEDVGQVIPEVVQYEDNGVDAKSIDYARLVALLIEGMKEQEKRIEELEETIRQMQP